MTPRADSRIVDEQHDSLRTMALPPAYVFLGFGPRFFVACKESHEEIHHFEGRPPKKDTPRCLRQFMISRLPAAAFGCFRHKETVETDRCLLPYSWCLPLESPAPSAGSS